MRISVVTSLYRSATYIEELHRRLVAVLIQMGATDYEIIFVNDGSPDESLKVAKLVATRDPHVTVIDLARNCGQHPAMLAGLERSRGDLAFILDSDLEEEPEWLALFHAEMLRTGCDVVFGVNDNIKGGIVYSICRRVFYKTLNAVAGIHFPGNTCTARLMTRRYVDALLEFREREIFMAGVWHMTGFAQMPVRVIKNDTSPTTYSLAKLVSLFVNAVTAFSTRPLIAVGIAGVALSIIAFVYVASIFYRKLIYGIAAEGWASVMGAVLTIGGLILFFNGVMAVYIAKIFIEVKQRPRSIVKEVYGSSVRQTPADAAQLADGLAEEVTTRPSRAR